MLAACAFGIEGSGNVKSESRNVSAFNALELKNAANVYITQGEKTEVRVEAEDNILPLILTSVKNNTLIIDCEENIRTHEAVNVYITVKELCDAELSGSGSIITKSELRCDKMNLRLSGSGTVKFDVSASHLKTTLSGSGNMELNGSSDESSMRISGSGNIDARKMKTVMSTVHISGSGSARVDVNRELNVNITGSGNVRYVSEPAKVITNITGSGEVQKI